MDELNRFLAESPIATEVRLTARIILQRLSLNPVNIGFIAESGIFAQSGGKVCELELGGQCIARGRIVRRMGKSYFKVIEMSEGGAK